jgi:hypothetical protein
VFAALSLRAALRALEGHKRKRRLRQDFKRDELGYSGNCPFRAVISAMPFDRALSAATVSCSGDVPFTRLLIDALGAAG